MGGGTSMVMQDKMSLEFLKQFCGDKFDQVKYNALHDEHGMVSKDMLMSTVMDGIAREVYYTYISYCPTGYMDVDEYSKMLRAAKFFSKAFNRPSAEVLFHAARFSIDESKLAVNFYTFIKQILPKLAEQRGTTGDQLFDKLAFVELGIGNHEMVETKPSLGASLLMATAAVASISHKQGPMPADTAPTPEQEKAATFLQTKARGKNAKRQVEEMRQIKNIRGDKKPQPTQRYPTISAPPDFTAVMSAAPKKLVKQYTFGNGAHIDKMDHLGPEIILEEVFQEYCAIPEEIDASGAKKMLRENNLLSKKFTTVDVDIIFRKTIANILAGPEESPLRNGVIFEKRINYEVFRSEFIGSVAKMRNLTLDDLLELLKQNYIALNRKRCSEHDHGLAPGNK